MEKRITAKNGIEIYGYRNPALHGFYISLFVKAGSMYELEGERGITHFLEHVLVRNVNSRRGGALYRELDKLGIEFGASTYSEMVQFTVSGAVDKIMYGADIITELFSPITISSAEVDAERKRIKAEIREADEKNSIAMLAASSVHSGTSLAHSILGTNSSVDKISRLRLEEYRKRCFNSENAFLYVTGAFSDADLLLIAEKISAVKIFTAETPYIHGNIAPVPQNFGKRCGDVTVKNADYTIVRFSFDMDMSKISSQAADIMYDMLLSGFSSPFFVKMSEERGLFYDLTGSIERYKNIGVFSFTYELKEKNLYDAIMMTVDILNTFKTTEYAEDECMKAAYVDNAGLLFDDMREMNFTFAYDNHVLNAGYKSIEDRRAAYTAITPAEIKKAANILFKKSNLTVSVKGNKKRINVQKIKDIVERIAE